MTRENGAQRVLGVYSPAVFEGKEEAPPKRGAWGDFEAGGAAGSPHAGQGAQCGLCSFLANEGAIFDTMDDKRMSTSCALWRAIG